MNKSKSPLHFSIKIIFLHLSFQFSVLSKTQYILFIIYSLVLTCRHSTPSSCQNLQNQPSNSFKLISIILISKGWIQYDALLLVLVWGYKEQYICTHTHMHTHTHTTKQHRLLQAYIIMCVFTNYVKETAWN